MIRDESKRKVSRTYTIEQGKDDLFIRVCSDNSTYKSKKIRELIDEYILHNNHKNREIPVIVNNTERAKAKK